LRARLLYGIAIALLGVMVRLALAPGSAGSDIPQFLAFAASIDPGPCMYQNAVPHGEEWPYPWPYPYGPVLAVILSLAYRLACPCSLEAYHEGGRYIVTVDPGWALTLKTIFTLFDAAIILVIYLLWAKEKPRTAAAVALAYALSPIALYTTAIYGMFDAVPTAMFLAGLYAARKSHRIMGGALMGLAAATKHTLLLPTLAATLALGAPALMAGLAVLGAASSVFLFCPTTTAFYMLAARVSVPGPTEPIVYSFNGVSALATLLYREGWEEALLLVEAWPIPFLILTGAALYVAAKRRDPLVGALLAYAAFAATYWRVNPQYMLTLTALVLAAMPGLDRRLRGPAGLSLVLVSLWPLLYPSEFWYYVHVEEPGPAAGMVDLATLGVLDPRVYVVLSLMITASLYVLVVRGVLACRRSTC